MTRIGISFVAALTMVGAAHAGIVMKAQNLPAGDFTLQAYPGWISASSLAFSIERPPDVGGGTGGTEDINIGVGDIQRFFVTKPMGVASAELFSFAVNGNSIGLTDIRVATIGSRSAVPTSAWRFDRAFVASYSIDSTGATPVEKLGLVFNKIAFASVTNGVVTARGWDAVANVPWTTHNLDNDLKTEISNAQKALPGDFVANATVDAYDFLAWQRGESPNPLSATDLANWRTNYGVSAQSASLAVPEPASAVLGVGLALLAPVSRTVGFRRTGARPTQKGLRLWRGTRGACPPD